MNILKQSSISDILFLDIETVSQKKDYSELNESTRKLWDLKARFLTKEQENASDVYDRASIYAEFGKIVCIGIGYFPASSNGIFRVKTLHGHDEFTLLQDFSQMLHQYFNGSKSRLCAHNGKEFDFPYISRRMLIHGIGLPEILDSAGKKPWETNYLDTMELWKFGDYKHFTSLNVLAHVFGLPTPKDDIDGSMVGPVYWQNNDLERIAVYCKKDVITLARVFLKLQQLGNLEESQIEYI